MDRTDFEKITAFIRRHHVMTLATAGVDGWPWCAHAFYAWTGEKFVFMNNPETRHGGEMAANARVAAGIALETRVVGRLQGLQIEGTVRRAEGDELEATRRAYLKRFPYAVAIEQAIWLLEPTLMKLTDNTLGFGKKLTWVGTPTAD